MKRGIGHGSVGSLQWTEHVLGQAQTQCCANLGLVWILCSVTKYYLGLPPFSRDHVVGGGVERKGNLDLLAMRFVKDLQSLCDQACQGASV